MKVRIKRFGILKSSLIAVRLLQSTAVHFKAYVRCETLSEKKPTPDTMRAYDASARAHTYPHMCSVRPHTHSHINAHKTRSSKAYPPEYMVMAE